MSHDVRGPQVDAVVRAVLAGRSVVLQGESGSGRTTVCRSVADRLVEAERQPVVVAGAEAVDGVPFAAVAHLVTSFGLDDAEPLSLLSALPARLASAETVVVVDDADRLDPATHVLLSQTHRLGGALVLATTEVGLLPRNLRDVVEGSGWEVHRLTPLAADAVLALSAAVVGDQLDAESAARVVATGQGSPARTVAFVQACASTAKEGPGGVALGPLRVTAALSRIVGEVPDEERDLVGVLATSGPLPAVVLERGASLRGAHVVVSDGVLRLRDVLVGAVVLAAATDDDRRRWCASAAGWLEDLPQESGRRTLLRWRAGLATSVADRLDAAGRAQREGHDAEAVELLEGLAPTPDVQVVRGAAWSGLGHHARSREALESVLAGDDEAPLAAALHELGLLLAVRMAEPAAAVAVVEQHLPRLGAADRVAVQAELVKWRLMAGLPVDDPGGTVVAASQSITGALIGAMMATMDGPLADAAGHVDAGLDAIGSGAVGPPFASDLLELSSFLALVFDGRIHEADAQARARRDGAATTADPALGMWEMATAELALHRGLVVHGSELAVRASRHLAWRDFTGLGPTTTALRAALLARSDRLGLAQELVGDVVEHRADPKVDLHVARVECELERRGRSRERASRVLADAARRALEQSHGHLGVLALDEAVMVLPSPDDVELLRSRADASPLTALLGRRAEALLERDGEGLAACAADLEAMGLTGRAAHAFLTAADLLDRIGSRERSRRWTARGVALASGSSRWACSDDTATLTNRESEVAHRAARRTRSREIAAELGLSVRTVDNHLARAFAKLGVASRDELPEALGLTAAAPE